MNVNMKLSIIIKVLPTLVGSGQNDQHPLKPDQYYSYISDLHKYTLIEHITPQHSGIPGQNPVLLLPEY